MNPSDGQRVGARAPGEGERLVMRQRWEQLLFLHWEVPAKTLQGRLPAGLYVDTFQGKAYAGVVPFAMRRVRPCWAFAVPGLSNFLELNVRTYVHDGQGNPGVWFFSLDANQPLAVRVARRWFHLNYQDAKMSSCPDADPSRRRVRYRCRRRGQPEVAEFEYPLAGAGGVMAEPGSLEFFLLERYVLYSCDSRRARLYRGQVEHAPYRYSFAADVVSSSVPLRWESLEVDGPPRHVAVAAPVDVRAYALRPVGERARAGEKPLS